MIASTQILNIGIFAFLVDDDDDDDELFLWYG